MGSDVRFPGGIFVPGDARFSSQVDVPDASIPHTKLSGVGAYTQTRHYFPVIVSQAVGSVVASETLVAHICRNAAEDIVAVDVVSATAPTGGDKKFTIDVMVGNQASAYATALNSVITVDNSKADRQVVEGDINDGAMVDGDSVEVVIAASGSTGTQGYGVCVVIWIASDPQ